MPKDVICGMYVDESKTKFKAEQDGMKYYFCSSNCLDTFLKPQKEMKQKSARQKFYAVIAARFITSMTV